MKAAITFVAVFAAVVGGSTLAGKLPLLVPAVLVLMSVIAFAVYAFDKSAARNGRRRISERTLHLLGLAGGWPGALLAQQAFRHKTKKTSFRIVFWLCVVINCAGLIWFFTSAGRDWLAALVLA